MRARGSPAKELFVSSVALSSVALDQEMPHQICFGLWRQISRGNFGSSFGFCFSLCEAGSVDRLSVGASSTARDKKRRKAKKKKKRENGKNRNHKKSGTGVPHTRQKKTATLVFATIDTFEKNFLKKGKNVKNRAISPFLHVFGRIKRF